MNTAVLLLATVWMPGADPVPAQAPAVAKLGLPIYLGDSADEEIPCLLSADNPLALIPVIANLGAPVPVEDADDGKKVCATRGREGVGEIVPVVAYRTADGGTVEPPVAGRQTQASGVVGAAAERPAALPAAGEDSAAAKLVVRLPAGARLFIEGQPVEAGAGETTFTSPPLRAGQAYYYQLRAEAVRGGQTIRQTVCVVLEAGRESWVHFPQLENVATLSWGEPEGR